MIDAVIGGVGRIGELFGLYVGFVLGGRRRVFITAVPGRARQELRRGPTVRSPLGAGKWEEPC